MKGRDGVVNGRDDEKVRLQDNKGEPGDDKTRVRDLWVYGKGLNRGKRERSAYP